MRLTPKTPITGLVILLTGLIWLGGFVEGWRNGLAVNTPPTGVVTACPAESAGAQNWQFEGWVSDREDGALVPEISVTIDSVVTMGNRLQGRTLGKTHWNARTRRLYRQWQLSIPVVELAPGRHTFVLNAVDSRGAVAELGRCPWRVVSRPRIPAR